jgi:hypothetical protein
MTSGGPRPGSGQKPAFSKHMILLRDTAHHRFQAWERGELSAIDVMRDNMEFFHHRASQIMATIMALPLGQDVEAEQLSALQDFAGVIQLRQIAQSCARDLARYEHAPMAAKPAKVDEAKPLEVQHIPTPKAVSDAFAAAAQGLAPEPRKRL